MLVVMQVYKQKQFLRSHSVQAGMFHLSKSIRPVTPWNAEIMHIPRNKPERLPIF